VSLIRRLLWRLAYLLEGVYLPIRANLLGLYHLIRGHNVQWFRDPDPWCGHLGWIYCTECADIDSKSDLVIWGFHFPLTSRFILQPICGSLGHKEAVEAMAHNPNCDNNDDPIFDQPTGYFYCSRCDASLSSPLEEGSKCLK
jgi:hypothetical protein